MDMPLMLVVSDRDWVRDRLVEDLLRRLIFVTSSVPVFPPGLRISVVSFDADTADTPIDYVCTDLYLRRYSALRAELQLRYEGSEPDDNGDENV
jgi:hypothetical protein